LTGDYVQIDFGNWIIDNSTLGSQIWKYQLAGTTYWVPSAAYLVSGNIYNVPVYLNYSFTAATVITLRISHILPDNFKGVKVPSIQWNKFAIYAYKSGTKV
jgi:hypothetical protein